MTNGNTPNFILLKGVLWVKMTFLYSLNKWLDQNSAFSINPKATFAELGFERERVRGAPATYVHFDAALAKIKSEKHREAFKIASQEPTKALVPANAEAPFFDPGTASKPTFVFGTVWYVKTKYLYESEFLSYKSAMDLRPTKNLCHLRPGCTFQGAQPSYVPLSVAMDKVGAAHRSILRSFAIEHATKKGLPTREILEHSVQEHPNCEQQSCPRVPARSIIFDKPDFLGENGLWVRLTFLYQNKYLHQSQASALKPKKSLLDFRCDRVQCGKGAVPTYTTLEAALTAIIIIIIIIIGGCS